MLKFSLAPTATYATRRGEWTPTDDGGALVLRLVPHSGREQRDVYAVEEQHTGTPDVREFLLLNTTDAEQRDVYRVTVGRVQSCTCAAGYVGLVECKHLTSMRMITTGGDMRTRTHKGMNYAVSAAHPAAERFPWLEDDELQELADDIAENGQVALILRLPDGRIVDGRNRELACRIAGVEPQYRDEELTESEVVATVKSRNYHRRHLSVSQRAAIAAEMATRPQGFQGQEKGAALHLTPTQSEAAAQLGVSKRSVKSAAKVKEEAPEVFSLVKDGSLDVHTAAKVADLPKREQTKVVNADDPKEAAREFFRQLASQQQAQPEPAPEAEPEPPPRNHKPGQFPLRNPDGTVKPSIDPDHKYAAILQAITNLTGAITRAMGAEDGKKLKALLTQILVQKLPHPPLVEHRAIIIGDKKYGARFVGLRQLRRIIRKAGMPGKNLTPNQLRELYTGLEHVEGDDE